MTRTGDKIWFVTLCQKKKRCPIGPAVINNNLSGWLSTEGGRENGPSAPDLQSTSKRRAVQDFHTMFQQVPGVNQGDLPAAQRVALPQKVEDCS